MNFTRYVLPVVVGAMAGMILITLGEMWITMQAVGNIDTHDPNAMAIAVKNMPAKVFVYLLVNYAVCSFGAGLVATLVGGRILLRPALVVGVVLTLAGLYNSMHLTHPAWFSGMNLAAYLPFSYLGYLVIRKRAPVSAG
jgi:hypothetical protein